MHEPKYEYLINKREQAGIKNLNDPHAFIEYSDDINDVLDDINNYNKNRDKNKINVSIVFITQSYFRALKDARLNGTHYIIMKIINKKE